MRAVSQVALVAFCVAVAYPGSAGAIIGGEPDGNGHPNVGMIFGCDGPSCEEDTLLYTCSGTLVAPRVVLTAAHCLVDDRVEQPTIAVSFDPDPTSPSFPDPGPIEGEIYGEPHPHPDWADDGTLDSIFLDIGVIELDQNPGITPALLPAPNVLDPFRRGSKSLFTVAGYGTSRDVDPPKGHELIIPDIRRTATVRLKKLMDEILLVSINADDTHGTGGGCFGDSGGPIFHQQAVVGIYTYVKNNLCQSYGGYTRTDAGRARAFLRSRGLVP